MILSAGEPERERTNEVKAETLHMLNSLKKGPTLTSECATLAESWSELRAALLT